ncbi:MAG: hypothetical protein EXS18_02635 [Verrucomicrobiae bacterium]|nr:hypothetical protein [Verrucomicrobiae bacterium]
MDKDKVERWVWFPRWAEVLEQEHLPAVQRQQYRTALLSYLHYCKEPGQKATVSSARGFMNQAECAPSPGHSQLAIWKEALNWFFRVGPQQAALSSIGIPPLGRLDLGRAEWEKQLIRRLRTLHYKWRTEETYRGWA